MPHRILVALSVAGSKSACISTPRGGPAAEATWAERFRPTNSSFYIRATVPRPLHRSRALRHSHPSSGLCPLSSCAPARRRSPSRSPSPANFSGIRVALLDLHQLPVRHSFFSLWCIASSRSSATAHRRRPSLRRAPGSTPRGSFAAHLRSVGLDLYLFPFLLFFVFNSITVDLFTAFPFLFSLVLRSPQASRSSRSCC